MLVLLTLLLIPTLSFSADRCQQYVKDFRTYAIQYNGLEFPFWYNIGCAMQESNCRADITSFDGGQGLLQLTPSTGITAEIRKVIPVDPYNAKSSIRAHSYYIMTIRTQKLKQTTAKIYNKYTAHPSKYLNICGENLADVYKAYNGGLWFVYESERGNFVCDNTEMKKFCIRGGTYTDKAKTKWLSFCEVNYSYPDKVFKYAQKYKIGNDNMRFYYKKVN